MEENQSRTEATYRLYETREFADLEIRCGTKVFKVHGHIVRAKSDYFAAAFFHGFKETKAKRIDIAEDPFLVARMIRSMYGANYTEFGIIARPKDMDPHARLLGGPRDDDMFDPLEKIMASSDENGTEESWISRTNTNVLMYNLADRYCLEWLKDMAQGKLRYACDLAHKNLGQLIEDGYLMENHEGDGLGIRTENELLREVPLIYDSTPSTDRGMRNLMLEYGSKNWVRLSPLEKLKEVAVQAPAFIIEMVTWKNPTPTYRGRCRRCKTSKKWLAESVRCVCGQSETVTG